MTHVHTFRSGGAYLKLSHMGDDVWSLHDLWSENRGQGDASEVMRRAMDFADQQGLMLLLVIQMYGRYDEKMLDNVQLEHFYAKHGFEVTDRRPVRMRRFPRRYIPKETP